MDETTPEWYTAMISDATAKLKDTPPGSVSIHCNQHEDNNRSVFIVQKTENDLLAVLLLNAQITQLQQMIQEQFKD